MVEIMPSVENTQARILVIGVGGAGNNAVNRMVDENIQGVELVGVIQIDRLYHYVKLQRRYRLVRN